MKTEYKKEYTVNYTEVDQNLKLGLVDAITFSQNMVTEYFESFKSDNIILKNQNNAIWVVSKTKVHFNKYPTWRDVICGRSYTTKVKPIRVEIETTFKNKEGENLFSTKQESCAIDLETRKIRKVDTVNYPSDMETEENVIQGPYLKLNESFSEDDLVYEQKVFSADIDYSRHTNNAVYVKYIANTLSSEFLDKNKITDFEIHYINESKEGQNLRVYKKVDVHKKYVKYKLYKETKIMEKEEIKKPFKVMKIGNSYCVIGDNIRFIAAKMMGFEKFPCLIIDTNKRRFLLRKNYKRNEIKDEKSETRMYGKRFNDCKRKYIALDI